MLIEIPLKIYINSHFHSVFTLVFHEHFKFFKQSISKVGTHFKKTPIQNNFKAISLLQKISRIQLDITIISLINNIAFQIIPN